MSEPKEEPDLSTSRAPYNPLNLWKGRSSREANRVLRRTGRFWQKEYFETRIRDSDHLRRAVHYTEHNPAKVGLVRDPRLWCWGSARLRDEFNRLPWQRPQERSL